MCHIEWKYNKGNKEVFNKWDAISSKIHIMNAISRDPRIASEAIKSEVA